MRTQPGRSFSGAHGVQDARASPKKSGRQVQTSLSASPAQTAFRPQSDASLQNRLGQAATSVPGTEKHVPPEGQGSPGVAQRR